MAKVETTPVVILENEHNKFISPRALAKLFFLLKERLVQKPSSIIILPEETFDSEYNCTFTHALKEFKTEFGHISRIYFTTYLYKKLFDTSQKNVRARERVKFHQSDHFLLVIGNKHYEDAQYLLNVFGTLEQADEAYLCNTCSIFRYSFENECPACEARQRAYDRYKLAEYQKIASACNISINENATLDYIREQLEKAGAFEKYKQIKRQEKDAISARFHDNQYPPLKKPSKW